NNGEPGVLGVTVYLDLNNNGTKNTGEPSAVTDSNGTYSLGEQLGGSQSSFVVRMIPPAGSTTTSPTSLSTSAPWGSMVDNFGIAPAFVTSYSGNAFTIRLDPGGTQEQIFTSPTATGSPAYTIPMSQLTTLTFTGTGSNDVFNADLTNGNPVPSGGV